MKTILALLAASLMAFAAFGLSRPAHAAPRCAPRSIVMEQLAAKYGETRRGIGLGANNAIVELLASEATGTWTITITTAVDGMTCLVASGSAFESLTEALPPAGIEG